MFLRVGWVGWVDHDCASPLNHTHPQLVLLFYDYHNSLASLLACIYHLLPFHCSVLISLSLSLSLLLSLSLSPALSLSLLLRLTCCWVVWLSLALYAIVSRCDCECVFM
jgi:hypothetical protein